MNKSIYLLLAAVVVVALTGAEARARNCAVLLHGLARSDASMEKMAKRLEGAGFLVVNYDYPSTGHPIEELSDMVVEDSYGRCPAGSTVHFVGHSLGGILVRHFLAHRELENLGRVVMLGPPNQGSQVVDAIGTLPGFTLLNGPAGQQLGTGKDSIPNRLGPADFEVGIIAGTRSINLVLSTMLPNPDDGKVSVESTKLDGMSDHITVPVSHPFLMKDDEVIDQTIHFLEYGYFKEVEDRR